MLSNLSIYISKINNIKNLFAYVINLFKNKSKSPISYWELNHILNAMKLYKLLMIVNLYSH
jgi:hypothetical protein